MNQSLYWQLDSWKSFVNAQPIDYPDWAEANKILAEIAMLPPLVNVFEIERLKQALARCASGDAFLLQGGDCAESFAECESGILSNKLKILLQMSLVLLYGSHRPIIRVGRIAGQYAKPRSSMTETFNEVTLPSFRGDILNQVEFGNKARQLDPNRMRQAYHYSAITLNYIRSLLDGGFASLEHPEYWQLDFISEKDAVPKYQHLTKSLHKALAFLKSVGGLQWGNLSQIEFYTSHEVLHLPYEQALTRFEGKHQQWYNLGTHFPWVGMRTLQKDSAHVEYLRGLANPVAIKVGPSLSPNELMVIMDKLDPNHEAGKLTLIHRFGVNQIEKSLPIYLEVIKSSGRKVLWSCDPMHGNTKSTTSGKKTRLFEDILRELKYAVEIHRAYQSQLNGVHFELTGENVTECLGGTSGISEADLNQAYKTLVDPRLNYHQALELALWLAEVI